MIPIIKEGLYGVDIETKPLLQFIKENNHNKKYLEDNQTDEEQFDIDGAALLPWTSEITGIGICWGNDLENTEFFIGDDILKVVKILSENKLKLCGHNIFFDWSHLYYHYELPLNFISDSGVISQCVNNSDFVKTFGLKQTIQRLYSVITQEVEIKEYLKLNHKVAESQYGKYLYLVPIEMLAKYCKLDAYYTRKIIIDSPQWLKSDITLYMKLYVEEVKLTMIQFIEGILIDKEGFEREKALLEEQIDKVEKEFLSHPELTDYIKYTQIDKFNKVQAKLKTKILDFDEWSKKNKFNINSTKQLKSVFDYQGLHFNEEKGKFIYPFVNDKTGTKIPNPESPKLGSKFLYAYGTGGKILGDRGEKVTLIQHMDRALDEAELTGKIHAHINLLGTRSGRISASGVNIVAVPIPDKRYGKNLIVEEGWSILSADFKALEPTILAALSDDPMLKYSCSEGVGKEPFIKEGKLWIDDIYLSAAYATDFMRPELEDKLDLTNWVKNSKHEKDKITHIRDVAKAMVLKSNYSAGAAKVKQGLLEDLKINESLKNIEIFLENYWATIAVAYQYRRKLELEAQKTGYLVNIGGFPLIFYDRPGGIIKGTYKALNRMIQSCANICMKLLIYFSSKLIRNRRDIIPLIINYHDASWYKVRNESILDLINLLENHALVSVNDTLKLSVKLRLGINHGDTFYDAK